MQPPGVDMYSKNLSGMIHSQPGTSWTHMAHTAKPCMPCSYERLEEVQCLRFKPKSKKRAIYIAEACKFKANVFTASGKLDKAADLYQSAMDAFATHLGLRHPFVMDLQSRMEQLVTLRYLDPVKEVKIKSSKASSWQTSRKQNWCCHLIAASPVTMAWTAMKVLRCFRSTECRHQWSNHGSALHGYS